MKKIFIIAISLFIAAVACKKEEDVKFKNNTTITDTITNVKIVGSVWKSFLPDFDDKVDAFAVYKNKLIMSYLYYNSINDNIAFSGEYNGSSIKNHTNAVEAGGFGFNRLRVYGDKLYGIGVLNASSAFSSFGVWEFDDSGQFGSKWEGYSNNYTDVYDMVKFNGRDVIATGSKPYVKWGNYFSWDTVGEGFDKRVKCFEIFNGALVAGGGFTKSGDKDILGVARWDGRSWQPMGYGLNGQVEELVVYKDKLVAVGKFEKSGPLRVNNIAIWDGTKWEDLDGGLIGGYNGATSLVTNGDELIVGGEFDEAGGVYSPNVIKWDGTQWEALPGGVPSLVGDLVIFKNQLYVTNYTSAFGNYLLRLE